MNYDWHWARLRPYSEAFLSGTVNTVLLTILVILFGTLLGVSLGLLLRDKIVQRALHPVLDVVRALPPLVLLLFLYYTLTPPVVGWTVPAFWIAVIGLSANLAAFVAELVRSAIDSVPRDDILAARALGLEARQITRYIVLPRVVRDLVPSLTVLYIGTLKMTSIASVINVREVVYTAGTVITEVSRSVETWTVVAAIYCVLVIPCTYLVRLLERRLRSQRPPVSA